MWRPAGQRKILLCGHTAVEWRYRVLISQIFMGRSSGRRMRSSIAKVLRAIPPKCVNEWQWLDRTAQIRMLREPVRRARTFSLADKPNGFSPARARKAIPVPLNPDAVSLVHCDILTRKPNLFALRLIVTRIRHATTNGHQGTFTRRAGRLRLSKAPVRHAPTGAFFHRNPATQGGT